MKIKMTNEWGAAHWATYTLTLTPQQQQQVEAYKLEDPEADYTASDIMNLLDLSERDVKDNGELTGEGSKVYYDEYETEIEDDEIYNAETKTFSTSERL